MIELTAITSAAVIGATDDGYSIRVDLTTNADGRYPFQVINNGYSFADSAHTQQIALVAAREIIRARRRITVDVARK